MNDDVFFCFFVQRAFAFWTSSSQVASRKLMIVLHLRIVTLLGHLYEVPFNLLRQGQHPILRFSKLSCFLYVGVYHLTCMCLCSCCHFRDWSYFACRYLGNEACMFSLILLSNLVLMDISFMEIWAQMFPLNLVAIPVAGHRERCAACFNQLLLSNSRLRHLHLRGNLRCFFPLILVVKPTSDFVFTSTFS